MSTKTFFVLIGVVALFHLTRSQAIVRIEGDQTRTVSESVGTTEVCVAISNTQPGDSATFNIRTTPSTALAGVDYTNLFVERTLNDMVTRACVDVDIIQNGMETGNTARTFTVTLLFVSSIGNVTSVNSSPSITIRIEDSDELLVGFQMAMYQVTGGSNLQICVDVLNGTINTAVTIRLTYSINPMNNVIELINMDFDLTNSTPVSCLTFSTIDDNFIKGTQYQTITLIPRDISVRFESNTSSIQVIDDNVATLSLVGNTMGVEVVEGNFSMVSTVTICINLLSVDGGLQRDIVVNVTTVDGTATVAGNDYVTQNAVIIIPSGTTLPTMPSDFCVNITIIGDNLRELNETFTVKFNAFPDILEGADNVTITIVDDGDVNECTVLQSPANGMVSLNGTDLGSVAEYSCISERFRIVPESSQRRTCGAANWDGVDPTCAAVCEALNIINGIVVIPGEISFIAAGTNATHSCGKNYRLSGNEVRTCQDTGLWSGSEPTCDEVRCNFLTSPANGSVMHSGNSVGAVATYSCFIGFDLMGGGAGVDRRVCSTEGTWTGASPKCSGVLRLSGSQATLLLAVAVLLGIIF